jgi:hypothetical protein
MRRTWLPGEAIYSRLIIAIGSILRSCAGAEMGFHLLSNCGTRIHFAGLKISASLLERMTARVLSKVFCRESLVAEQRTT